MNRIIPLLLVTSSFSTFANITYVPNTSWYIYKSLDEMTGELYISMSLKASNVKDSVFSPELSITCTSSDGSVDGYYVSSSVDWNKVLMMEETSFYNQVLEMVGLPYDKKDIQYRFSSEDKSEKGVFDSQVDKNKIAREVTTFLDPNGVIEKLMNYADGKVSMRIKADSGVNYTLDFNIKGANNVLKSGLKECSQASKLNFNKI